MKIRNFKRAVLVLLIVAASLGLAACKRAKQIPNDTLADIFKEMYLLNAYIDRTTFASSLDSVDVYKPILEKYGYTDADFRYTLTEATKRKSFRLSDIVDKVITSLEGEYAVIQDIIKRQYYVDSLAYAISGEEIYNKLLITRRKVSDTAAFDIPIKKGKGDGSFNIKYYYKLDSLGFDTTNELSDKHELVNKKGDVVSSSSLKLRPGGRMSYETTINGSPDAVKLRLKFGSYLNKPKRINLTIDSLVITRRLPREEALKALVEQYAGYKLMIDGKEYDEYFTMPTDSSALDILPPLAPKGIDSLGKR